MLLKKITKKVSKGKNTYKKKNTALDMKSRKKRFLRRWRRRRWFKKHRKDNNLNLQILPYKFMLLRDKVLKNKQFSLKIGTNQDLLKANNILKKRLLKFNISPFWGSFIKNGVRPTKMYFYVLKVFRSLLGLNISFFIKIALEFLRPVIYLKPRRFGAFIHLIPRLITLKQSFSLAKRFLIKAIKKRKDFYLGDRIINELFDVFSLKSAAFQYKKDVYSEVVENRVYLRRRRGKKSF